MLHKAKKQERNANITRGGGMEKQGNHETHNKPLKHIDKHEEHAKIMFETCFKHVFPQTWLAIGHWLTAAVELPFIPTIEGKKYIIMN